MRPVGFPVLGLSVVFLLSAAGRVQAQSGGEGFLFRAPQGEVSIRGGFNHAAAGSDLFTFTTSQLTLNPGDFSSLTFATDVDVTLTQRLSARFGFAVSQSDKPSEFRDFVDNNDQPIEQTTTFERVPFTANLKLHLAPTGRSVGTLAWIPSRFVPYIGGGVGVMRYRFEQQGDFVDFNTNAVFPSTFDAQDWAFVEQVMAGAEYNVSPMFGVTFDARYLHGRGNLGAAFKGYDKIDLSGVSGSVGLSLRL